MSENEFETTADENPDAALENTDAALLEAEGLGEAEETEAEIVPADLEPVQVRSILESILLASDKPLGTSFFKEIFKGTNIKTPQIREALEALSLDYMGAERGLALVEVGGGYQLRTKPENSVFVRRMMKGRPFKLSGPALEVLAIIAYKQPIVKAEVDEIRGVESGHLMRALMDRGLIRFDGKSELPGKPMLYATTRKFLEIFGLKDLRELPSLNEIDQLIPEGIGDDESEKEEKLGDMHAMGLEYKADTGREEEWEKISADIAAVNTSTDFFEQEKARERAKRDADRADDIRERMVLGEAVEDKDKRWLAKYEAKLAAQAADGPAQTSDGAGAAQAADGAEVAGDPQIASAQLEETVELDGTAAPEGDADQRSEADDSVATDLAALAAESLESLPSSAVTETPDESAVTHEGMFAAGSMGDPEPHSAATEAIEAEDASKLSEILEGLKNKNAVVKDTSPSEREHLKQSVYRPDQLAQALKDFDDDGGTDRDL